MTLTAPTNRSILHASNEAPLRAISARAKTLVAAVAFAISGYGSTVSAQTACDAYQPSCSADLCECGTCGTSHSFQNTPIYRSLDTVAGGIEKLFGLDRCKSQCCGASACDGGCDSAEWLIPIEASKPTINAPRKGATPLPMRPAPRAQPAPKPAPPEKLPKPVPSPPRLPSVPPLEHVPIDPIISKPRIVTPDAPPPAPPTETAPRQTMPREATPLDPAPRQTTPRIVDPFQTKPPSVTPDAAEMTQPRLIPVQPDPVAPVEPPAMTLPESPTEPADFFDPPKTTPETQPEPKKEGSIFDALDDLDDPFKEDAARLQRQYGVIRPTGMRSATKIPAYRPVHPRREVHPRLTPTHQPIGSGLRPTSAIAPLRPVNHEEPVQLRPMGTQRVLAPYRRSRS